MLYFNPLEQAQATEKRLADPCTVVIFGMTGDLTKRKLIPALCNLARDNLLADKFAVVGFARSAFTTGAFREQLMKDFADLSIHTEPAAWQRISQSIYYVPGSLDDAGSYRALANELAMVENKHGTGGNR